MKEIFDGFRFGMILQLAVGSVCLLVLQTAATGGFMSGAAAALGVAITDAVYIALSGAGIALLLRRPRVARVFRYVGAFVLILFGIAMLLSALSLFSLPTISLGGGDKAATGFLAALLLTLSNPLTILFWGGVFATRTAERDYSRGGLVRFAAGCVLSTLLFMTGVAVVGALAGVFLPDIVMRILNGAVGAGLVGYGFFRLFGKKGRAESSPAESENVN